MRETIGYNVFFSLVVLLIVVPQFSIAQSERPERQVRESVRETHSETRSHYSQGEILVRFQGEDRARRIRNTQGEHIETLVARYERRSDVLYAEPNYLAYAQFVPNDPFYYLQWHFDNPVFGGVHAEGAWETTTGQGVTIAVIDTGVAYENYQQGRRNYYYIAPDLAGTDFVPGYDFVNSDTHPNDDEGHGTHVAGTLAQSTNNSIGLAGLAHGAKLMPIKVLGSSGSGSYADIADGIRFAADNGADVINLSLGGSSSSNTLADAVEYAYNLGVTIVAAAGNSGYSNALYPAAFNAHVIAVGATRYDETLAPYSNYGSSIDIVAPGGDTTVDQNGDGYGDGVLQQTFGNRRNDWGYYFYQGTSMATPHVAAAAALLISHGAVGPDEVRALLQDTADDLGAPGRDDLFGHGLLNIPAALYLVGSAATPPPPPLPPTDPEPEHEPNETPVITSTAPSSTTEGDLYTYDVDAMDPNAGDIISYSLTTSPFGMSIDTNSGLISWTPDSSQIDTHDVTVVATDDGDLSDSQSFEITVFALPLPPPPPSGEIVVLTESFENDLGTWTQDDQSDWQDSGQRATDGNRSAQVDGSATDAALTSPTVSLQGKNNARISFDWLIERRLDYGEYLAFDVSTDGGESWTERARLRGNVDQEDKWIAQVSEIQNISIVTIRFRGMMSRGNEDANVDAVKIVAY